MQQAVLFEGFADVIAADRLGLKMALPQWGLP